jgi:hypothetical protein
MDEFDDLELDDDGRLYWRGKAVIFERRVGLEGPTFWVALAATFATVVSALWPILVRFGVFGI